MTMEKCVETKVSQNEFTFCENVTYIFFTLKLRETSQEFHVWSNMKQYFFHPSKEMWNLWNLNHVLYAVVKFVLFLRIEADPQKVIRILHNIYLSIPF